MRHLGIDGWVTAYDAALAQYRKAENDAERDQALASLRSLGLTEGEAMLHAKKPVRN